MKNVSVIYMATNTINGKSYIGFDSNWPNRMKRHKNIAKRGAGQYFHKAITKYGWDNFVWEILLYNATFEDETRLIKEHGTFINGYNLTEGGDGVCGYKSTPEQNMNKSHYMKNFYDSEEGVLRKEEYSRRMKDFYLSEKGVSRKEEYSKRMKDNNPSKKLEVRNKIGAANRISLLGKKPWNKGKNLSQDMKDRQSKKMKKFYESEKGIEIKKQHSKRMRDKKIYNVVDPNGNTYTTDDIRDFCEKNGLDSKKMQFMARKVHGVKSHKGWKCTYPNIESDE